MFDMDTWMPSSYSPAFSPFQSSLMPSTLDLFDTFDPLDQMMSRNLRWIDRPESWLPTLPPAVPQKYRISVDCAGFNPDSIKTELKEQDGKHVLLIHGRESAGVKTGDDYFRKEIKKTFVLPDSIELDKMTSFMTPNGQFVVEFPLRETEAMPNLGLLPQIQDTASGKQLSMQIPLPQNIDPNKVQVSVKDRDLIMRVEDKSESPDSYSRVHIYTRTTLPENTDFSKLKCTFDNNLLSVTAPVSQSPASQMRNIPLEMKQQQQQIGQGQQQQYQSQQQQQPAQ